MQSFLQRLGDSNGYSEWRWDNGLWNVKVLGGQVQWFTFEQASAHWNISATEKAEVKDCVLFPQNKKYESRPYCFIFIALGIFQFTLRGPVNCQVQAQGTVSGLDI